MGSTRERRARSLIEQWQGPLYRYALRWLGDEGEAEDATQEVFIEVLRDRHQLRDPEAFKPWVYKVASRVLFRRKRRRERRNNLPGAGRSAAAVAPQAAEDRELRELIEASLSWIKGTPGTRRGRSPGGFGLAMGASRPGACLPGAPGCRPTIRISLPTMRPSP